MENQNVSFSQYLFSIVLFNFGSSVVLGINNSVGQDTWISILLGAVLAVPLFCAYSRLTTLFPQTDLFTILQTVFGKVAGKVLVAVFTWYSLHLAALVLGNFTEFTQTSSLPETPRLPIMILMILTTVYLARKGMKGIGKWSMINIFVVVFVVFFSFLAAIPQIKMDALMPFFEHSPDKLFKSSVEILTFPYAETVVFFALADAFKKKENPYKMLLVSLSIVVSLFLIIFVRNIATLGRTLSSINYFPSYMTARTMGIGDFLARIEGSISTNFLLAGIVKIAVCLLAASKGIASLFNLPNYQSIVLPVGLLTMGITSTLYESIMDMFKFIEVYAFYAFPFQVILPVAALIAGEIYVRKHNLPKIEPYRPYN